MKMPIPLRYVAYVVLLLFIVPRLRADDGTFGNLTTTGTNDLQSGTLMFGTWSEGIGSPPGFELLFQDGTLPAVNFVGSGTASVWQWW